MKLTRSLAVLSLASLAGCSDSGGSNTPGTPNASPSPSPGVPTTTGTPTTPTTPGEPTTPTAQGPGAPTTPEGPTTPGAPETPGPTTPETPTPEVPVVEGVQGALISLPTCESVDEAIRAAAIRGIEQLMQRKLEQARATIEDGTCYLSPLNGVTGRLNAGMSGGGAAPQPVATSVDSASAPEAVSETNNQVAGVDEADFVKNDDRYIYAIAKGALQIVEAWPAASARVVASIPLEARPKRLFLDGDRLLVFTSIPEPLTFTPDSLASWWYPATECTYGYDCDFTGDGSATRITIFDISDRTAPEVIRTIDTAATFISARRIGSAVHTLVYQEPKFLRRLPIVPPEIRENKVCSGRMPVTTSNGTTYEAATPAPGDLERAEQAFEALAAAHRATIEATPIEELFSGFADSATEGVEGQRDCAGFYDSPLADGTAFLTLVSLDLQASSPLHHSTIISRPGASYASKDSYYVSVRQNPRPDFWFSGLPNVDEASTVHKFTLSGARNQYAASGVVAGRVLNQFSMDEYQDHLRIVTTKGRVPNPDVQSALTVLRQNGQALEVRGMVDGIAPSEDVRSVRFVGDKGYVVTFKKTDPLFVFDLSDPTAPRMEAELKIPGFSTYMHPFAPGHLLTIGYDAADHGDFAYFTGLLLQVFDVRDAKNPTLTSKVVIGTRGSASEAATNHLGFNFFAPRETLAVPVTVCEGGDTDGGAGTLAFSGVQLYRVTPESGINLTGAVSHPYVQSSGGSATAVGARCSNWWTRATSLVKRTIFMDDFVYSVSAERIKVNDLRDLSQDVADVAF